jgi:uncharacterized protein
MRLSLRPLLLAVLLLAGPGAGQAQARPAVWVVRDADSTILVFGSVHALPPGLDWKPQALIEALAKADDLWFETPNDEADALASAQAATARGLLPREQSLSSLLDRPTRERLEKVAASLGVPMATLDRYRPWMAEVILAGAYARKSGAAPTEGVETKIATAARAGVGRRAFETPEQQVALLADVDLAGQVASLKEALGEIESEPGGFAKMVDAWMSGDPAALFKEAVEPMRRKTPAAYRRLVAERNRAWASAIEQRLRGSGRTVVVVGAGHLVGPDGVPTLLRRRGLAVEGP